MMQLLPIILIVAKVMLFIFEFVKKEGQIDDANRAVEAQLAILRRKWRTRAATAVDSLDTTPSGVREDIHNRDARVTEDNHEGREDSPTDRL